MRPTAHTPRDGADPHIAPGSTDALQNTPCRCTDPRPTASDSGSAAMPPTSCHCTDPRSAACSTHAPPPTRSDRADALHPAASNTDALPPTRWTDPRIAAAYATRRDGLDRTTAWPRLTELLTNPRPRRGLGRPDATILELGSGPGHYAHHLAEHHWTATYALDISPAIHRHGEQNIRDAWIRRILPARDGSLPLRGCQCTGALAHLLFCHIRHPADILALLTEARRVLRPHAPLALVEPGEHGRDFQTLRYGHPDRADAQLEPGEPYPVDYTLTDDTRLRTTAYHHPPALLADLIERAGFGLDPTSPEPLHAPAHGAAPFLLWTARAR
ncbi:class I SAM-dependent methyltransferase [Actinospica sp.]|uniref:class I SAM-dependent methyltransferase n=1 Tax=Actinospica sp. TaxID=1872142 RepID=UPI002CEF87A8|nr:class I SAM-dependent methyltransferase [Actinospica sp.]HWG26248.1 class I SAM-dependent methyltransferase [Actinospica sp.]